MKHVPVEVNEIIPEKIAQMANWATNDSEFASVFCGYLRAMKSTPVQAQNAYDALKTELIRVTNGTASDDALHQYFTSLVEHQHGNNNLLARFAGCEKGGRA